MAVKIRLRRMGQKKHPFYRIVVADSRSPRDGRCIAEIGTYDPNTDPSCFLLFDKHYFKTIYILHYNQSIEFNAKVFVLSGIKE